MEQLGNLVLCISILLNMIIHASIVGCLAQNLYVASLSLTSATFASAMTNLIPAITFIMAVTFGLERFAVRSMAGKAKMLGTLVCVGGAMLLTFYKGAEIKLWSSIDILHQHDRGGHPATSQQEYGNRVLGSSLAVASCLSYSTWLIIQTKMSEKYPCYYSSTAMLCGMASLQAVVFALCMDRDWAKWKLGFNIRLLTVAYSGILASGLMVTLLTWCMRLRGPLFVSVFNPLMLVLVALAGSFFLNEKLHLGSVLGAILIVGGLYIVLWGKAKEMKKSQPLTPSKSGTSERIDIVITSTTSNTNNSSLHCVDELADIDLDNLEPKSSSVSETNVSQRPSIQEMNR